MKKKKLKDTRKFLNPTDVNCSGVISMFPTYNEKTNQLSEVSLTIRDCSRAITLDFTGDGRYDHDVRNKHHALKNSIQKINILKDIVDSIREELLNVVLVGAKTTVKKSNEK
jgi:hypothetical protein